MDFEYSEVGQLMVIVNELEALPDTNVEGLYLKVHTKHFYT